jgi:RHS repeat-associated protein
VFNPVVLKEIVLPNGQSYKFSYNAYGELDKMIYPKGAYQRYQYSGVGTLGLSTFPYTQGSRGIVSRFLSPNGTGGADEVQWTYSGIAPLVTTAPDGTRTESYPFIPNNVTNNFGYQDARQGVTIEERVYAPVSQGGAMLRRSLSSYGVTTSIINKPVPPNTFNTGTYTAYRNPRTERTVSLMLDTGGDAFIKNLTYEYIDNGLQFSTGLDLNATNEFHFATVDSTTAQTGAITAMPTGTLASRSETTYLNNSAYQTRNLLSLPTSVILKDGNLQTVSRTDSFYDEVAYPLLTYGDLAAPDYIDPGTNARGNVTTLRRYVDIALLTYQDTHSQYDQCGNLRNAWNVRNILDTQTDYSSTYKHAYPTQITTAIPDPSGAHGSNTAFVTSSTFDFNLGLTLTTTDENAQVTTYSYLDDLGANDPLNRLRKITRPDGGWTKYSFGETPGNLYSLTETLMDASRSIKTYVYTDPLGRITRTFASEIGTSYIAKDTIYDQLGRVWKASNPYRTTTLDGVADLNHTPNWTTSTYDPLGRILLSTLPDGATIQTTYQGIYTTVTDQALRQRRQKTDAMGRVIRVDEPNSTGSLGTVDAPAQPTSYDYNTQGKLIHITQGSSPVQHRYFKYDALGRMTYERQVEQAGTFTVSDPLTGNSAWSRKMVYDETIGGVAYTGLLTTAYDARNVSSQYRYDQANRIYQVDYSDGTPTVNYNYDQFRTGYFNKNELTQALTAATAVMPATAQLYDRDLMGRVTHNQQTVGGQSYDMSYTYNLGNVITSQTYPSGRVVSYSFDDAARLSTVSSGATTYASQFDYTTTAGLLKSVLMGNGGVETFVYNSRLQLQSLDLTRAGTQIQHYDLKFGVYDPGSNTIDESKNTDQIAQIEGFIGGVKQWQQRFGYDTLGRLTSAREFRGDNSAQSYLANYEYDLFGNRYQKAAQNGGNPFTQKFVETGDVDQATNRFAANVTYDSAGNIITDSKFRNLKFQYDANNRQKQSSNLDDSGAVVSVYDAGGQRVGIQVGGTLTSVIVYDASAKLIAEYNTTTANGGTQYIFNDQQGSPRAITSTSGVIVARHDYVAFGDELGTVGMRTAGQGYGGNDASRKKYASMEKDEATGMSHTLWRKFDSLSARWTTPDPFGGSMELSSPQSFNRYAYVNNDPVNHVDLTGLMLSDIGVFQTSDPAQARAADQASLRAFQMAINANWAARNGGVVDYKGNQAIFQFNGIGAAGAAAAAAFGAMGGAGTSSDTGQTANVSVMESTLGAGLGAAPAQQRNNRRGGRRGGGRRGGQRQQRPAQPQRVTVQGPTAGATPISAGNRGRSGVVITYSDGTEEVRRGGTRTWRNNNPGNIRGGVGQIGVAGGFGVYRDEATGAAAMITLMQTPAYQARTLDGTVYAWAPPNENNTAAYQAFVRNQTGLAGNTPLSTLNAQQLQSVADAIRTVEGWRVGTVTYTRPRTP